MNKDCKGPCGKNKPLTEFGKYKRSKDGHRWMCRECRNIKDKNWVKNNLDKHRATQKRFEEKNPDKILEYKRRWKANNRDKVLIGRKRWRKNNPHYSKIRRNSDVNFKIQDNIRTRFKQALKNNYKSGSAIRNLGCSIDEFKVYLESKFQVGMSWDNYSATGWHIDHIKPLSSFDLSDLKQTEIACHYTNLQPLWAKENLSKNNRIY